MSSNIILIGYLCFLFMGLFFILKNVVRLYKEVARAEELLSAAGLEAIEAKRQLDLSRVEIERMKIELERKSAEVARKENEAQQSAGEAKRAALDLQVKSNELMIKGQEMEQLAVELEGLKSKQKTAGVQAAQYKDFEERLAKFKSEALVQDQEVAALKGALAKAQLVHKDGEGKAEALAAKDLEIKRLTLEMGRLESRLPDPAVEAAQLADKNALIQRLNNDKEQMAGGLAVKDIEVRKFREALESKAGDLVNKDLEIKRLSQEFQQVVLKAKEFKESLESQAAVLTGKESELERLKGEYPGYDERVKKLRDMEGDITRLEKSLEDEKHALRNVRMRAQESKMKLDLLGEKTKEAVEAIAKFAESGEFEEFRKAVHMDETIRKYEDEIKHLKIQVIELEKKI